MTDTPTMLDRYRGDGTRGNPSFVASLPPADMSMLSDPAGYRPSPEARDAVNVALLLGMPLLISGDPGSGKTQLGYAVAHELGLDPPRMFVTKSTSQARDLFYRYDAIRHFRAAQTGGSADAAPFLELQPLGCAIRDALADPAAVPVGRGVREGPQRRSMVIIDEIDKAPRDFPNDLLFELDSLRFDIPELGGWQSPAIDQTFRPIIFITSNAEQLLPAAFLRRCAFLHLRPPTGDALAAIIERRFQDILIADHPLVRDVVALSDRLHMRGQLERAPSSAELLQFLSALLASGGRPDLGLRNQPIAIDACLALLAKSPGDMVVLQAEVLR